MRTLPDSYYEKLKPEEPLSEDGWISWDGSSTECPIAGNIPTKVKTNTGGILAHTLPAKDYRWYYIGEGDIVAYKIMGEADAYITR